MISNKEITLIIHGPISIYTILSLYRYQSEHPIVLVLPKPTNAEDAALFGMLQHFVNDTDHKIDLVTYSPEKIKKEYNNEQNRYFHFFSVGLGLELCHTEYALKLRSDEFYSKLSAFAETIDKHKTKVVTNDIFFRKHKTRPLHPCDHLMGGKTTTLKNIFRLARTYCEDESKLKKNPYINLIVNSKYPSAAAEQVLGIATLTTLFKEELSDDIDEYKQMRDAFEIVTSDKLGFFRVSCNSQTTKQYFDTTYFNEETDINNIRQYKSES